MRKHIKNNVSWVGKIDWELQEFHGSDYSINNGSSQKAYLIEEEKPSSSIPYGNLIPQSLLIIWNLKLI